MKANIPDRTYYKIGEVSSILGVKPHIVRYWVSEFPQIRLKKTKSGQRLFTRKDIDLLLAIERLVIGQEYTVSGAKARLQELRDIGVENEDLHLAIERLQDVDLIEQVLVQTGVEPQHLAAEGARGPAQIQETLAFEGEGDAPKQPAQNDDALRALQQELSDKDQAIAELKARVADVHDIAEGLRKQLQQAEQEQDRARQAHAEERQALQDALEQEQRAHTRRIELTRQSLIEERQFYADEQNILTLYIEELEESLYQAREACDALKNDLADQHATIAKLRADVQTRAMQQRYALRKTMRDAKRQRDEREHIRSLAHRLQERINAQRAQNGSRLRDDSD